MVMEQRREERLAARDMSKGELYHPGSGQYLKVDGICDISSTGIGLKVNAYLPQGEKVRLGVKYRRAHVHLYGQVVWCAPLSHGSAEVEESDLFMMGITL